MPLTEVEIINAIPGIKPIRMFDGGGLYLELAPSGGKWWRLKYRFCGKEKRISLGVFPAVSLMDARYRRDDARKLLANNIDPGEHRKSIKSAMIERSENSFETIAREWFERNSKNWGVNQRNRIIQKLQGEIFPRIGSKPISNITAKELLGELANLEENGTKDSAQRTFQNIKQIIRYAITTGRMSHDPSLSFKGTLIPVKRSHHAAIIEPEAIGGLLRKIDCYQGHYVTKCALRLAPLFFVRPGELRKAEWKEIDFGRAEWNIPAERMKLREPHLVPLSKQSIKILRELYSFTGGSRFVFPGARSNGRPMSDNTILAALRRMGFAKHEMSGNGFRAMARNILHKELGIRTDFIELQLGHATRGNNKITYKRTAYFAERRNMMQRWADYLDMLKSGGGTNRLLKKK